MKILSFYLNQTRCVIKVSKSKIIGFEFDMRYRFAEYAPSSIYLQISQGILDIDLYTDPEIDSYLN